MNKLTITKLALSLLAAGCVLPAHAAVVGKVISVAGEATATRQGKDVPLPVGAPVESGDLLKIGEPGNLQVRFNDDAIVALRSNSQLRIDNYAFANKPESDSSVMSLLKGGMRTITGAIGRVNRDKYSVNTPTSTIGIRGTHFTLVQCDNDCRNADGSAAANGTFGGVTDGRIAVTNDAGEREFGRSEFFFVSDRNSLPAGLLAPPSFLRDRLEGQAKSSGKGSTAATQETASVSVSDSNVAVTTSAPLAVPQVIAQLSIDTSSITQTTVLESITTAPPTKAGGDGKLITATTGIIEVDSASQYGTATPYHGTYWAGTSSYADNSQYTWDSAGLKRVDCGSGCFVDRGNGRVAELGADAGVLTWSRWNGGPVSAGGWYDGLNFTSENSGISFVLGIPTANVPSSGTYTYNLLGATQPTFSNDTGGGLGKGDMTSGTLTVDFVSRTVAASMQLQFVGGNSIYNLNMASTSLNTNRFEGSGAMQFSSGTIDVCSTGGSCYASFKGFLAGEGASHAGLGYDITAYESSGSPFYINGVAGFKTATPVVACTSYPCTYGSSVVAAASGFSTEMEYQTSFSEYQGAAGAGQFSVTVNSASNVLNQTDPLKIFSGVDPDLSIQAVADNGLHPVANLSWGRYTVSYTEQDIDYLREQNGVIHFMAGDPVTNMPGSGIYTFNHIGGTRPTDHLGNMGTLNSGGSWTVDFGSQTIATASAVNWTVDGITYNLTAPTQSIPTTVTASFSDTTSGSSGSITQRNNLASINLTCSPNCTVPTGSNTGNNVSANFFGKNAEALGVGYSTKVSVNGDYKVTSHVQGYKR